LRYDEQFFGTGAAGMAIRWGGWNLRAIVVFSAVDADRYVPPRLALAMPPTVVIQLGQG